MPDLPLTVYTPESPLRAPGILCKAMLRDLYASRELAWRLFVRDISASYRQSILGYVWAFVPPLVTTLTFGFLNSQKILNVGETTIPYPAFVMVGTLLWSIFMDSLNCPMRAVGGARDLLARVNFPREALIVSGMADVLFNLIIRLTLLVPTFFLFRLHVDASLLLVPFALVGLMSLGLAIGLLLLPLALLYQDVGRVIALSSSFWMLLTPVVYPPPVSGPGAVLATWNPVSPVLLTCRQWLTAQPATNPSGFVLVAGMACLGLVAGWIVYRLALPHLIERMGN